MLSVPVTGAVWILLSQMAQTKVTTQPEQWSAVSHGLASQLGLQTLSLTSSNTLQSLVEMPQDIKHVSTTVLRRCENWLQSLR